MQSIPNSMIDHRLSLLHSLYVLIIIMMYSVLYFCKPHVLDNDMHDLSVTLKNHQSYKWFAIQFNHHPIQYFYHIKEIKPLEVLQCIEQIKEGDLLKINYISPQQCDVQYMRISATSRLALGLTIHLNQSTQEDLESIKGVGKRLAQLIIKGQPWKSIDDLMMLKGVGYKKLAMLKRSLTLSESSIIFNQMEGQ